MKQGFFVGRVGGDAEVTYTPQGIAVAKFSLAIDNGKDKEGQRRNATWVKCAIWRDRAEKLAPYIKKGIVVAVSGDVDARAWIDKQSGEARCQMEMNVNQFTFGGSSSKSEDAGSPGQQEGRAQQEAQRQPAPITDEDIPF
jgi:single-strand DNA-binding protein